MAFRPSSSAPVIAAGVTPIAPDQVTSATLTEYFVFDPETVFTAVGGTTAVVAGGTVGQVNAKNGRSETLTQSTTANQPTWVREANSGRMSLAFNGTSQGLMRSYTGPVGTILIAYAANPLGNNSRSPQYTLQTVDSSYGFVSTLWTFSVDGTLSDICRFQQGRSDGTTLSVPSGPSFGAPDIVMVRADGTTAQIEREGKLCSVPATGTGTPLNTGASATLGARLTSSGFTSYFRGNVLALITFSGKVSDAEAPGLAEWLKRQLNKPASLGRYAGLYFFGGTTGIGATIGATSQSAVMVRSDDLINWTQVPLGTFPDAGGNYLKRDYGAASDVASNAIYVMCTKGNGLMPLFKISDRFTPVYMRDIDASALTGSSSTWAPEFIKNQDGSLWKDGSGLPRVVFSWNSSSSTATYKPSIIKPADGTWINGGAWGTASLIPFATVPTDAIDLSCVVDTSGTAHLFYAIRNSGFTTSYINYATSPTGPDGTFTIQGTAGADTFGFGSVAEGPQPIYRASDSSWIMHVDRQGTGYYWGRNTTGPGGAYSASKLVSSQFVPEHGTMFPALPGM